MAKSSHRDTGFSYFIQGQTEEAAAAFRQALHLDPRDASAHFGLGLCWYAKEELDKALGEFAQVLEIDPQHRQADYQLGLCYCRKKDYARALHHLERAMTLDPTNGSIFDQLGQVHFEEKRYDLAVTMFKKSLELSPENSLAHQALGSIYLEQGLFSLAGAELNQAVQMDAHNVFARQMMGYSYRKQGRFDLAIDEFIKATELFCDKGKTHKKPLKFSVKILRMPDFCKKADEGLYELRRTLLPPLALGKIVSYLRANAVEIDQDDLNIRIHHDNRCGGAESKRIDSAVFFDEERVLKYVSGTEDAALESIMRVVEDKTRLSGYRAILFSLREIYANPSSLLFTLSLARFLKKKYDPVLILGGSGQSIDLLRKYDCRDIDHILYGESETVLLRLLLALDDKARLEKFLHSVKRIEEKVIFEEAHDAHPPLKPDFSGLPMDAYKFRGFMHPEGRSCRVLEEFDKSGTLLLPFKFIKGCPHECAFCTMSGDKYMFILSPATTAAYLRELQAEHHPTGFFFLSDTLNISKQYVHELCDEILKSNTKILWSDCARADNLDKETLLKMRQAGCIRLIFGIETASPRLLKRIRKGINVKKLEETLRWADEAGIWTGVEIICGLPHEQDSDIEETIAFLNNNKEYIDTTYVNQFDLRDGSLFLSRASELGIGDIAVINQYANEEFSNFHKYGFNEINGLLWSDKKKQIVASHQKLLSRTKEDLFPEYALEHLLFFLYDKFGDKKKVRQAYDEITAGKEARKIYYSGNRM